MREIIQTLFDVIKVFRHYIIFKNSINIYENIINIVLNVNFIKRENINYIICFTSFFFVYFVLHDNY